MIQKKLFLLLGLLVAALCNALASEVRAKGFVYLHEVDPTILISPRYYSNENFLGARVDGYRNLVIVITRQAAEALKNVQADLKKDGYSLVVYDGYRPQRGVNHFMRWSEDVADQLKKSQYYPRVDKAKVFELGYVARRSGHSRGSTIDLTIIKDGQQLSEIKEEKRVLLDGYTITLLNDGTVDMGASFDLFDKASHIENDLVPQEFKQMRTYLRTAMQKHGFKPYSNEWWHFTLSNEPFPADQDSSYFDFEIE